MKTELLKLLAQLGENDGATLKAYKAITYKSGYQVATEGLELVTIEEAAAAIISYEGSCGIWFSNGIYYIDKSHWVKTKHEALRVGREHQQISILGWKKMELIYC